MVCKSCPIKRHCWDKGVCEKCDFGKAFDGYNKKIHKLKDKKKELEAEIDELKARIDTLLHPDF